MRVISILLGIAVVFFLLWPNMIPVGFGGAWWASHQALAPEEAAPSKPALDAAKDKTAAPSPPAKHALIEPQQPAPANGAPEKSKTAPGGETLSADKTGALASKTETVVYRRVMVRDAGTLQADGVTIKLAGVSVRDAEATCKDAAGKTWPCGGAAKAALAKLIRARAVTCTPAEAGAHNIFSGERSVVARCAVAGTDLSAWMVRQGWATPQDKKEALLVEAASAAEKERLGIWRDGN